LGKWLCSANKRSDPGSRLFPSVHIYPSAHQSWVVSVNQVLPTLVKNSPNI
jgi:hypothetical protein